MRERERERALQAPARMVARRCIHPPVVLSCQKKEESTELKLKQETHRNAMPVLP